MSIMKPSMPTPTLKTVLRTGAAALALTLSAQAAAQGAIQAEARMNAVAATETPIEFDLPAQSLAQSLNAFGVATGRQVLFSRTVVDGQTAPVLRGRYAPAVALSILLSSADLDHRITPDGVVLVGDPSAGSGEARMQEIRAVQPAPQATRSEGRVRRQPQSVETEARSEDDQPGSSAPDVIVVTGTNIRGIAPESSPVLTFDQDDIRRSGAATAQDFLRLLPQNFGGGSTEFLIAGTPGDASNQQNSGTLGSLGSGVNLRGLGSGSTLVLLNGNRMAPASGIGDFVDISLIPASVIERVDVLTDGASSIYGGDAVAGVINFVLSDDFEGAEVSARYGFATQGGREDYRASATLGRTWDRGNLLAVYEYFSNTRLRADDRGFAEDLSLPNDLLPSTEKHSFLLSGGYDLTTDVRVALDVLYAQRDSVSDRNFGSGIQRSTPEVDSFNASASLEYAIFGDWVAELSGTYSDVSQISKSDPLPGSADTRSFRNDIESTLYSADLRGSGSLFELPSGAVRAAVGVHYRAEDFFNPNGGAPDIEADREVAAAYGELLVPVISPENNFRLLERLELNISGRFEDYSDFGDSFTPKVGVILAPSDDVRFRASWSESFNPPPLGRVGTQGIGSAIPSTFLNTLFGVVAPDPSIEDVVVLTTLGPGTNLQPEESEAITFGLDFDYDAGRGTLSGALTWFDIEFDGRLGSTPRPNNISPFLVPNLAFTNPELFPVGTVIFFPTDDEIAQVLAQLARLDVLFGVDPADAEIINFVSEIRNLAKTEVSGLDANVTYAFPVGGGVANVSANVSYLDEFVQQAAPSVPAQNQLNLLYNPVDLRVRSGIGYAEGRWSFNAFVNYVDAYEALDGAELVEIDSWTTLDLNISYQFLPSGQGLLSDLIANLSINNVFDQDPPDAPSFPRLSIAGYDPTNASPIGRFVSLDLTKRF